MSISPSTTLVLVRHGATDDLEAGRLQGQHRDSGLSLLGISQVDALARHIRNRLTDAIYCSNLQRARETALRLAEGRDGSLRIDERLREFDFGPWEGLTLAEIQERWPGELPHPYSVPHRAAAYGGESIEALFQRADAFFQEIAARHSGQNILVVAHAQVLSALLCAALKLPVGQHWCFGISPASVSTITVYPDGTAFLQRLNETAWRQAAVYQSG